MRAGDLPHRVELQRATGVRNEVGEEEQTWTTIAQLWAGVKPLSGRELWNAQQVQPDVTHEVSMRFYPGVTPKMRIKFRTRILNIVSAVNVDENDTELRLVCVEPT